jgi:hypothetical protein
MLRIIRALSILTICLAVAAVVIARRGESPTKAEAMAAQDAMGLDRRISSLEQRLYSIESNINQLQQRIISSQRSTSTPYTRDPEVDRLRLELETLQQRIREVECGVVKLDERTLPANARESRRPATKSVDPCRQQPETPVQLTSRRP